LRNHSEAIRRQKNESQARRLKAGYEGMLMFEEQRVKEKKERQALRNLTQQDKLRTMVVNF